MKTITTFILFTFLALGQMTIAQETTDISELLDRLHGNHMGSIYDVFTVEEVAQLGAHFDAKPSVEPERIIGGGTHIRATENSEQNSVVIDPSDVSMIDVIAPSPLVEFEGAGATIPGTARAIVVDNNNFFYEVDSTGMYNLIGQIPAGLGQSFTGLEYTSDGELYGIATDGMGSTTLYFIDLMGGQAKAVGGDNGLVVGIALGRDMNNNLYSYDIDTDLVHRIDRMTGMATVLGPIGFDAEFGQGLGYDSNTDRLLATAFNSDSFKPELRSIDITTGASTLIGTIFPSSSVTLQFAWMSFFDNTLGVNDANANLFTMFPNPANTTLTIAAEMNIQAIKIYNTVGQEILTQTFDNNTIEVDVSSFNSGLYIIQIASEKGQTALQFIKG